MRLRKAEPMGGKPVQTVMLAFITAGLLFAGCATKADYIRQHPAMDKGHRYAMQNGEVQPGFTKEMVRLTMGSPSNITAIQSKDGTSEIWLYPDIIWIPLIGNVKNEYRYVYFLDDKVTKVKLTKGSEKYLEKMEKINTEELPK
jgi:hypothetical protein